MRCWRWWDEKLSTKSWLITWIGTTKASDFHKGSAGEDRPLTWWTIRWTRSITRIRDKHSLPPPWMQCLLWPMKILPQEQMHNRLGINNRPPIEEETEGKVLDLGPTPSNIVPIIAHTRMTGQIVGISLNTPGSQVPKMTEGMILYKGIGPHLGTTDNLGERESFSTIGTYSPSAEGARCRKAKKRVKKA